MPEEGCEGETGKLLPLDCSDEDGPAVGPAPPVVGVLVEELIDPELEPFATPALPDATEVGTDETIGELPPIAPLAGAEETAPELAPLGVGTETPFPPLKVDVGVETPTLPPTAVALPEVDPDT